MDNKDLSAIVEALLMSADKPLSVDDLLSVFDDWQKPEKDQINQAIKQLEEDYQNRAIELKQLASGYCFQTRSQYGLWISRLYTEKPVKYSRALLETLAIIAYRQPVTRADIEDIRGVAVSSSILKTLVEREWIKIAGHRDVPGKPGVYVTTKNFLDYFNMATLHELPPLSAHTDPLPIAVANPIPTERYLEDTVE